MTANTSLRSLVFLAMLLSSTISVHAATLVTFDDLPSTTNGIPINTPTYHGLVWETFEVVNSVLLTSDSGPSGYDQQKPIGEG